MSVIDELTLKVLRQIRDALTTAPEVRAEHFRLDRLAEIAANRTPVTLPDHPKTVLHMIPFASVSATPKLLNALGSRELLPYPGVGPALPNAEGVITHNRASYTQVYRTGIIEAVDASYIEKGEKILAEEAFTRGLHEQLGRYVLVLRRIRVEPPVALMLTLLGVGEVYLRDWAGPKPRRLGVHEVICPAYVIEQLDDFDPLRDLRPSLDVIANAAGLVQWEPQG